MDEYLPYEAEREQRLALSKRLKEERLHEEAKAIGWREKVNGHWFRFRQRVSSHTLMTVDDFVRNVLVGRVDFTNVKFYSGITKKPDLSAHRKALREYVQKQQETNPAFHYIVLDHADLSGIVARELYIPIRAFGATLDDSDWTGSAFPCAYFNEKTSLKKTNFSDAEFADGRFYRTTFEKTRISGAHGLVLFDHCDLRGAAGLETTGFHPRNFNECLVTPSQGGAILHKLKPDRPYIV